MTAKTDARDERRTALLSRLACLRSIEADAESRALIGGRLLRSVAAQRAAAQAAAGPSRRLPLGARPRALWTGLLGTGLATATAVAVALLGHPGGDGTPPAAQGGGALALGPAAPATLGVPRATGRGDAVSTPRAPSSPAGEAAPAPSGGPDGGQSVAAPAVAPAPPSPGVPVVATPLAGTPAAPPSAVPPVAVSSPTAPPTGSGAPVAAPHPPTAPSPAPQTPAPAVVRAAWVAQSPGGSPISNVFTETPLFIEVATSSTSAPPGTTVTARLRRVDPANPAAAAVVDEISVSTSAPNRLTLSLPVRYRSPGQYLLDASIGSQALPPTTVAIAEGVTSATVTPTGTGPEGTTYNAQVEVGSQAVAAHHTLAQTITDMSGREVVSSAMPVAAARTGVELLIPVPLPPGTYAIAWDIDGQRAKALTFTVA